MNNQPDPETPKWTDWYYPTLKDTKSPRPHDGSEVCIILKHGDYTNLWPKVCFGTTEDVKDGGFLIKLIDQGIHSNLIYSYRFTNILWDTKIECNAARRTMIPLLTPNQLTEFISWLTSEHPSRKQDEIKI